MAVIYQALIMHYTLRHRWVRITSFTLSESGHFYYLQPFNNQLLETPVVAVSGLEGRILRTCPLSHSWQVLAGIHIPDPVPLMLLSHGDE